MGKFEVNKEFVLRTRESAEGLPRGALYFRFIAGAPRLCTMMLVRVPECCMEEQAPFFPLNDPRTYS